MTTITTLNNAGILSITLNNPDKLNSLSESLLQALEAALISAKNDVQVKGLILTGAGKAFCAGADIKQLAKLKPYDSYLFAKRGQAIFRLLETMGKPSLAAVNGYAFGGGCELAMAASMRIAASTAKFAQPEVKLGVIPGYGGTQRLSRLIGKGRALDLCLSGRIIDAQQALQWGLISTITQAEELLNEAEKILSQILANAPLAIANVLNVIDKGHDLPLEEALDLEALQFALSCATHDKQEGVNAFLEKRQPHFKGE